MSDWMSSEEMEKEIKTAGSYSQDNASAAQRRIAQEHRRLTVRAREVEGLRELLSEQAREYGDALGRTEMELARERARAEGLRGTVDELEIQLSQVVEAQYDLARVTSDEMAERLTKHFADTFIADHSEDMPAHFSQEVLTLIRAVADEQPKGVPGA